MSTPVLEMQDVSASYSTYRALFGVSLTVPSDGIVALVGSNGAGKSTLARVATGLVPVSEGTVRIAGEDITKVSAHRIARMGVTHVPEGRAVFSSLTVEENLTLSFLKRVGRRGVGDALARAYDAFPVLAERRKQQGGTLSGGQQRILSLAKVLAVAPKLLVVDELSLGLAPVIVDQVYDGLVAIHEQGCALLVVEQQVDRALAIADRAILLVKGAVAWEGPAADAKPVLESQMLSGASSASANGSAPSANGTSAGAAVPLTVATPPAPPAVAPNWSTQPASPPPAPQAPPSPAASWQAGTGPAGPAAAPNWSASQPPPSPPSPPPAVAQQPPAPAPSSPGTPPGVPSPSGQPPAGAGDGATRDGNGHPAGLWIVGPTFPGSPS
jgi:branched-chain amino acid transport system ATP-binding protein